ATALSGDATVSATGVVTIASGAIGAAEITDGTIANADVAAAAAIAYSKLAAMSTGQVLLGNGTTPTATALSGDATVSATGVVTLASNAVGTAEITDATIANADIAAAAAIAYSKLAALNTGQVLLGNGTTPTAPTLSGDATVGATGTVTIAANAVDGTNISIASEGTGDLMLFNGADWSRLAAGASGELLTGNGAGVAPSWQTASSITGTLLQHPVLSRRVGLGLATATNATTFTGIGIPNPTVLGGAGTANPAIVGATNFFINYATTAVSANANGLGGAFTQTRPAYRPKLSAVIRTDSTGGASIANTRMWVGITEATLAAIVTNTSGTTASTTDFVGVAYDTNGTGNTTDWLCCSGDGANYGCTTTGVAVATNTDYTIIVDWTTGGNLVCTVNGTSVSKGTNLSTNAVNLGTQISITTLSAAVRTFNIAKYSIEQN
ncbi:MAG: hypothetical protein IT290_08775, partial [Deltaproteobacteria bacterium]|nr:hypothetical protein [Deltaproteobacteria bacterium]